MANQLEVAMQKSIITFYEHGWSAGTSPMTSRLPQPPSTGRWLST